MTDVVQKLDAWLKSHNQATHDEQLESMGDDLNGVAEELQEMSELLAAHFKRFGELVDLVDGVMEDGLEQIPRGLTFCARTLTEAVERLDLALEAGERAS